MHTISTGVLLLLLCASSLLAADPAVPRFRALEIDAKVGIGYGVAVADVDGDGKKDVLLVDKDVVAWYRNPSWEKHIIAEKLTALDHVCIAAADIDGDGKAEIAVGAQWNPGDTLNSGAVFYLIPPADRTQKWSPVELAHEPTVHRMRWVQGADGQSRLVVVPLHGRGNKGGQGEGVKVMAYRKPADPLQPWATEVLDESLHMTHNFDPVQWDGDPGQELLIGGKEGTFLLKMNPGRNRLTPLTGPQGGGVGEVRLGRLGEKQRFFATVEPMHGNSLVVYTAPAGVTTSRLWERHVLDETLVDGHALACRDFSGLGRDQIVVGWRAMNRPGVKVGVKLFTPLDSAGTKWGATLIDDNTMACEDLTVADLDGDGRLDIVAAGRATKNLKIYFNQGQGNP